MGNRGFVVNAEPVLKQISRVLAECKLEAILIGNAAAALQGAPVTNPRFRLHVQEDSHQSKRVLVGLRTSPCWIFWSGPEMRRRKDRAQRLDALKRENERAIEEQIRRLLALPMNKRTHFLRVRLPPLGSTL